MINDPRSVAALRAWTELYGLPTTYCAVDTESSGLNLVTDRILHLGWCRVEDGKAVSSDSVVIDWSAALDAPAMAQLSQSMERTKRAMNARGNAYRWNVAELHERGVHPRDAANRFLDACGNMPLVAHHGWGFDYPLIARFVKAQTGTDFTPPHTDLMDTCLMARAYLAPAPPRATETYHAYVRRLSEVRCAKHTLDACVINFGLTSKGVDTRHAHDAEYDAWIAALLLERFRELATAPYDEPRTSMIL